MNCVSQFLPGWLCGINLNKFVQLKRLLNISEENLSVMKKHKKVIDTLKKMSRFTKPCEQSCLKKSIKYLLENQDMLDHERPIHCNMC